MRISLLQHSQHLTCTARLGAAKGASVQVQLAGAPPVHSRYRHPSTCGECALEVLEKKQLSVCDVRVDDFLSLVETT